MRDAIVKQQIFISYEIMEKKKLHSGSPNVLHDNEMNGTEEK